MSTITLSRPIATRRAGLHPLERLHLFAGRAMGEVEFDLRQAYLDYRLQQLGNAQQPGILRGLELISPQEQGIAYVAISAGLAVTAQGQILGLSRMIRADWNQLVAQSGQAPGPGVFYLILERSQEEMDGSTDTQQPCHRQDPDPLRDMQKITMGQLRLRRANITPPQAIMQDADSLANQLCQQVLDQGLPQLLNNTIALGLVALNQAGTDYTAHWIRAEAGRYLAINHSAEKTLSTHYNHSIRRTVSTIRAAATNPPFNERFEQLFQLRYLPAFGALPLPLLEQPDALPTPTIRGLPNGMNIDMMPVPQSTLAGIMEREISRGVIDLHQPSQSLRLLLAVKDEDYRADLLDRPDTNDQIEDDVYHYHQRTHNAWISWQTQFNHLYHWLSNSPLSEEQKKQLRLPTPIVAPVTASNYYQSLIDQELNERNAEAINQLPLPYRDGIPSAPANYTSWLIGSQPPTAPTPQNNGLAVQYLLNQDALAQTRERIDTNRIKLDKVRDLLVRQRQLLDSNTVSMATLAGGVSTDGSGLQIARWWPHMEFNTDALEAAATAAVATPPPDDGTGETTTPVDMQLLAYTLDTPMFLAATSTYSLSSYTPPVDTGYLPQLDPKYGKIINTNSVQFDYTQTLDSLASVINNTKQKPSEPQFKVQSAQFGVMKHLDPALSEYRIAHEGINDLFDDYQTLENLSAAQLTAFKHTMSFDQADYLPDPADIELSTDKTEKTGLKNRALFRNSRVLTRFIASLETQNDALVKTIRNDEQRLKTLLATQQQLSLHINEARQKLHQLDALRAEYQGDYAMTQALLREEWNRIEKLHEARSRVLNSLTGLYFVKVRRTPVSRIIRQTQPLRHELDDRLLPGCIIGDERELPDSLDLFFDAVLEAPLNSWASLTPYLHLLPSRNRIYKLEAQRQQRLQVKKQGGFYRQTSYLNRLFQQAQGLFFGFAQTQVTPNTALTHIYKQAQNSLSLEDIQSLPSGKLHQQAKTLKQNLSKVLICLLDTLRSISPGLRLHWAQLAEDDRIPLSAGSDWPGLEKATRDDTAAVRSVLTLIGWWLGQQSATLSTQTNSALRDMIRAVLIEAALGEPEEIVRGQVKTLPPRFRLGERFRLHLNHEARPGLNLHLLNPLQQIVGVIQLEDEDEQGPVARIIEVNMVNINLTTEFTVVQVAQQLKMG